LAGISDTGPGCGLGAASQEDLEAWRARARELTAGGEHDEALQLHRRYFAASRAFPALYGVRLSFALREWAELAEAYPPAREALTAARQEAVDRLLARPGGADGGGADGGGAAATPGDAFAEVEALSDVLGEPEAAVALFEELDARAPQTAADCAIAAHRLLIRSGRHDLARRHLGDPLCKVTRLAEVLQMRLERGYTHLPEQKRDARRREAVRDYVAEVRAVLVLLTGPDDAELAERTRARSIEGVSWGHVRDEVAEALAS
jgi:tetratricopeptide (TPR) repeat protein